MEVIGTGGVFVFDLRNAELGGGSSWALYDVLASYLTSGDKYRPQTGQYVIASGKTSLRGREQYSSAMTATGDIFSSPNNSGANGRRKRASSSPSCRSLQQPFDQHAGAHL